MHPSRSLQRYLQPYLQSNWKTCLLTVVMKVFFCFAINQIHIFIFMIFMIQYIINLNFRWLIVHRCLTMDRTWTERASCQPNATGLITGLWFIEWLLGRMFSLSLCSTDLNSLEVGWFKRLKIIHDWVAGFRIFHLTAGCSCWRNTPKSSATPSPTSEGRGLNAESILC